MSRDAYTEEDYRELEERVVRLTRANKRLSGALSIVLDTLDSENVAMLFDRVLDRITETFGADGTLVYFAASDGFHLRGATDSLSRSVIPEFMDFGRSIETLAAREGHALRLRVSPPDAEMLRAGSLAERTVVREDTQESFSIEAGLLPPFASFICVPVWFGGHVISIIEVGWQRVHALLEDDALLLDSVARYLGVQLMGAFTALRSQRAARLRQLGSELREELMAVTEGDNLGAVENLEEIWQRAADALVAHLLPIRVNVHQGHAVLELPGNDLRAMPFDLDALSAENRQENIALVPIDEESALGTWLVEQGEPAIGTLIDLGDIAGARRAFMLLRPQGAEPYDGDELAFIQRLAQDSHEIALGEVAREQDKRIAQALMSGMKSELQTVEGISARGIYSSATASALVGGDFYDLIRLPERRACVIMGDVSVKGVEAASVSAAVRTALGAYAWEGLSPARMVRTLNDFLLGFSRIETFATLFVGIIDLASGTLTYCSAGHPPALFVHAGETSTLGVQSGVVGAFADISYRDGVQQLAQGDLMLLYTDGTTEARSPSGAFFGEDGLADAVAAEVPCGFNGLLDRLLARLDAFTCHRLEDDVALVALRFDKVG